MRAESAFASSIKLLILPFIFYPKKKIVFDIRYFTRLYFLHMKKNTSLLYKSPLKGEDLKTGLICLLPSAIVVLVFIVFPIFFSLFLSVHEWSILTSEMDFVGLGNFDRMFHSREFWLTLKNTFVYTIGVVPIGAAASLGLALLLNRKLFASGFFKTAYFLPVITSTIAVAIVWFWIFDTNNGLLNIIIRKLGGEGGSPG